MINLNDRHIRDYKEEYFLEMRPILKRRYKAVEKPENQNIRFAKNKFCAQNKDIIKIFGNNETEFLDFAKILLTEPIEIIYQLNQDVKFYMEVIDFLYSIPKELQNKLNGISSLNERKRKRREIIENRISMGGDENKWLRHVKNDFVDAYDSDSKTKEFIKEVSSRLDNINDTIKFLIAYKYISPTKRHEILLKYNLEVCPYCNRNYISKFEKEGILKTTADLDHFYGQDRYQLLSLSLYNFVPSCQICNLRMKGSKGYNLIHPYTKIIDYSKLKFDVALNNESTLKILYGENNDNFDIKLICEDDNYRDHIELFQLENLYNSHKQIACEVLYKKQAYNESYDQLMKSFFEGMNFNDNQKNLFLYGIELDEVSFHKRPLSKFTYDLINAEHLFNIEID